MREQSGQTLEIMKRCSGLHGNMQRLAEMTSPFDISHSVTSTSDNPTEIVRSDVDGVVAALQNNDGEFIAEEKLGELKFGSAPVRDAYFGLSQSNMIGQFENVAGFIAKAQYPNDKGTLSSEWCSIGNVRFFVSSRGSITNNASGVFGADVYNNFIVAQEAYASIELDGSSAQFIYHPPGSRKKNAQVQEKSSLIDMETRRGNMAQAEVIILLAA